MAIHVYSLTNLLPVPTGTVDTPPEPTSPGEKDSLLFCEVLEEVCNLGRLCELLGRNLSKDERDELKKDGCIEVEDGTREIRLWEIDPSEQIKDWQTKAFNSGVKIERERVWNLLHYFHDELAAAFAAAGSNDVAPKILKEFGEMVLDATVAPVRYHMKGSKLGRPIPVKAKAEPTDTAPTPDICIECGSPLDEGGHCHFVDCAKAVPPHEDINGKVVAPERDLVCFKCKRPFGPNPNLPKGQTWPKTVCVTLECESFGKHVAEYADTSAPPLEASCKKCGFTRQNVSRLGPQWWQCNNPRCQLNGIQVRETLGDVHLPPHCIKCLAPNKMSRILTQPGWILCMGCNTRWAPKAKAPCATGECVPAAPTEPAAEPVMPTACPHCNASQTRLCPHQTIKGLFMCLACGKTADVKPPVQTISQAIHTAITDGARLLADHFGIKAEGDDPNGA